MGEKEFFDKVKKYNRFLSSDERGILIQILFAFLNSKGEDESEK